MENKTKKKITRYNLAILALVLGEMVGKNYSKKGTFTMSEPFITVGIKQFEDWKEKLLKTLNENI